MSSFFNVITKSSPMKVKEIARCVTIPFRVRTKVVSRAISKLRNYNKFYCCHGWTVNEKGDECTQRNSFSFHLSPMM